MPLISSGSEIIKMLLLLLIFRLGIHLLIWSWFFSFMIVCFLFIRFSQGAMTNNIHRCHHHLVKDYCNIYTCDGCKMEGSEVRYMCSESCNFALHLECKNAKEERTFQEQKFQFHTKPLPRRPNCTRGDSCTGKCWRCHACGRKVKGYVYHCPETDQVFHPLCFPKLEYHPSHDHGLMKDEKCEGNYTCHGCKMEGIGKRYICSKSCCKFELHLECMHAAEEHTFKEQKFQLHSKPLPRPRCTKGDSYTGKYWRCDACGKKVKGFLYHCSETNQVFHPLCFPKLEYHPSHDHGLVKDEKCEGNYTCDGCKMEGIGRRYICSKSCYNFELHFECMHAAEERTFKEQKFQLHIKPLPRPRCTKGDSYTGKYWICDACGKKVKGFLYHCSETDEVFHPLCYPKLEYHPSHDHGLVKDEKREGNYTCDGCKMEGIGRRYKCSEICCNFELHLECMHAEEERTFQERKLLLYKKPPPGSPCSDKDYCIECRRCDACGEDVKGFVYHCSKTGEDFHPTCTKLPSKVSIEDVTFLLEETGPSTSCAFCQGKMTRGKRSLGWSYVSKHNKRGFHVCCVMNKFLQRNSISSKSNAIGEGDSSLSLDQRMNLPLQIKCKNGCTNSSTKIMKIVKTFLSMVISICLGDPTAIIFSAVDLMFN